MRFRLALWALALLPCAALGEERSPRQAPTYAASSLTNLATGKRGPFAPNMMLALVGQELSVSTTARDTREGANPIMPIKLGLPAVTVKINGMFAPLEYVSPEVVVFLVPNNLVPGPATIRLTRNNLDGPALRITLDKYAPSLFELEENWAFARHGETLLPLTEDAPALPGEVVVLYAAGLGDAIQPVSPPNIPQQFMPLEDVTRLAVSLNGVPVEARYIVTAGVAAKRPGCYEIYLLLPSGTPENPEITISMGEFASQSGLRLRVSAPAPQPGAAPARTNQ
jgi:uncharacterized protein (TIGR03437 family)